jgi:antitoxin (DNA-binding transcriptional repressor) of toxin-antitoxin stability system
VDRTISAKELRASLPRIVERVRRGERFTVLYRSRPSLRIVPVTDEQAAELPLEDDPLYRARPVGATKDGLTSADHDRILYGR